MFETFSFLPPLTDAEIARQVDYIVINGWSECNALLRSHPPERSRARRLAQRLAAHLYYACKHEGHVSACGFCSNLKRVPPADRPPPPLQHPPAAPCLEFAGSDEAYASNASCTRMTGNAKVLYYDNRYW